jgi:hypothetical protein
MQFSKSLLFTAAALIAPIAMHASALTSLSLAPITTVDGAFTFSNFSCATSFSGAGSYTGTCAALNVSLITGADGIQFQEGLNATNGDLDVFLSYKVTANTTAVSSIGMLFNGSITPPGTGTGTASVTEQAIWFGTITPDSQIVLVSETLGGNGVSTTDSGLVNLITPLGVGQSLTINKDINLTASSGSTANLSYVDQAFLSSAPEPATSALMGGGLMLFGLALRGRFGKKQVA